MALRNGHSGLGLLLLLLAGSLTAARPVSATNYYINSEVGSDTNAGTSVAAPWKGFRNLSTGRFEPGDSILFAKGTTYTGGFVFTSSGSGGRPIVFGSYSGSAEQVRSVDRRMLRDSLPLWGAGRKPAFSNPEWSVLNGNVFRIEGSHIVIEGLYFHDNARPPGSNSKTKNVQKLGAVYLALGTSHNVVRDCEFENTPVGIKVKGTYNLITRNYLHDSYEPMAESWGPIAIMIVSPYNEISYNRVTGYGSYGGPYGSDGGVIELDGVDDAFDGRNIVIHHNVSIDNHGFLELAGRNVDSVTVAYNLSDDRNQFIGGGSMKNVHVYNNTVIRTREPNVDRYVFWTFAPEATEMKVRSNIFVVAKDIRVFGPVVKPVGHVRVPVGEQVHDHNLFYSPGNPDPIGIAAGMGEIVADPRFVDAPNGNFRLRRDSPARGAGVATGYREDLDGYPVPAGGGVNLGAYEG